MRSNFQQIVSYCLGLHTQNPGLREVDLEPSPKRGSDKINMQKQGRNTQKNANISQSKGNQTMKFGQLIEYNKEIIFFQKLCRK